MVRVAPAVSEASTECEEFREAGGKTVYGGGGSMKETCHVIFIP